MATVGGSAATGGGLAAGTRRRRTKRRAKRFECRINVWLPQEIKDRVEELAQGDVEATEATIVRRALLLGLDMLTKSAK